MVQWAFVVSCGLVLGGSSQGLAQQPTQKPATPAESETGPKRPAGPVARPENGVQHPDLDKAWADYDAAVAKAAESIRAAINKQFDAATAKGDLDEAEKWQDALERYEKRGEVPADTDTKSAVSSTVADCKRAREELLKAYESVVKALTIEKNLTEARAIRDEAKSLASTPIASPRVAPSPEPSVNTAKKEIRGFRLVPSDMPDQCVAALTDGVRLIPIDKSDDTAIFKITPGLADPQAVSFESVARPGHFLRHSGFRLHLHAVKPTDIFRQDVTFRPQQSARDAKTLSLQAYNYPSRLIRHRNEELWIDEGSDQTYFQQTTFRLAPVIKP